MNEKEIITSIKEKDTKMMKLLIGSSIFLLASLFTSAFTGIYKLMALGFTQYILMLICVMAKTSFRNTSISNFFDSAEARSKENFENKKYVTSAIYFISTPLVIIGVFWTLIITIAMWFLF